jgi:hypothetical protein
MLNVRINSESFALATEIGLSVFDTQHCTRWDLDWTVNRNTGEHGDSNCLLPYSDLHLANSVPIPAYCPLLVDVRD